MNINDFKGGFTNLAKPTLFKRTGQLNTVKKAAVMRLLTKIPRTPHLKTTTKYMFKDKAMVSLDKDKMRKTPEDCFTRR